MTVYNVASISNTTFAGNTNITSVDLSGIPIVNNNADNMFNGCTNLQYVYRLNKNVISLANAFCNCYSLIESPIIPDNVESMYDTFYQCTNLIKVYSFPDSVKNISGTFRECHSLSQFPIIPNGIISMDETFSGCANLVNTPIIPDSVKYLYSTFFDCNIVTAPIIPNNVVNMSKTFAACRNLTGDITIKSTKITNATNCFSSTSLTKNVYMPITYENGVNTATYNSFIAAGYDANGTTNGVYIKDIDTLRIPNWTWTESGNKVTLTTYNGANNVVVPNVETLRNL